MAKSFKPCSVPGCNRSAHWTASGARGWCATHHYRWRKHGSPLGGRTPDGEGIKWLKDRVNCPDKDNCLKWPFGNLQNGYGKVGYKGNRTTASRVMCTLAHGEPPTSNHEAAHSCGNGGGGCVNPHHLRWATRLENAADKVGHGTHVRGGRHGNAKLTEEQVHKIRSLADEMPHEDIGAMFGVSQGAVSSIQSRRTWGWLPDQS